MKKIALLLSIFSFCLINTNKTFGLFSAKARLSNISISIEDKIKPESEILGFGNNNEVEALTNLSDFIVNYEASDIGSGVDFTNLWYRHNLGDWQNFGNNFNFDSPDHDGIYQFYTRATDLVGNIEDPKTNNFKILRVDTESPFTNLAVDYGVEVSPILVGTGHVLSFHVPNNSYLIFSYKITSQDTADFDYFRVSINGEAVLKTGSGELNNWVNDSGWQTRLIFLDNYFNQDVNINFEIIKNNDKPTQVYLDNIYLEQDLSNFNNFYLVANDLGSGVEKTFYRIDSGDWQQYSDSLNFQNISNLEFYSTDFAGNQEAF